MQLRRQRRHILRCASIVVAAEQVVLVSLLVVQPVHLQNYSKAYVNTQSNVVTLSLYLCLLLFIVRSNAQHCNKLSDLYSRFHNDMPFTNAHSRLMAD